MSPRQPFRVHSGIAAPIMRQNIDTDALFPGHFIRTIDGDHGSALFGYWRYLDVATLAENPDFVLNREPFRQATLLIAGANFGCGSSREHAVWALVGFGIRAVIAESFGDIFAGNAIKNGLLPVVLPAQAIDELKAQVDQNPSTPVTVDLDRCIVTAGDVAHGFQVNPAHRLMLMEGLDEIGLTLRSAKEIDAYQAERARRDPWIFGVRDAGAAT